MALATRINPSDIINQLLRDKLLAYIDGNYFIKTGASPFLKLFKPKTSWLIFSQGILGASYPN